MKCCSSKNVFILVVLCGLLSACDSKNDIETESVHKDYFASLNAGVDDGGQDRVQTRCVFTGNDGLANFYWQKSDCIGVAVKDSEVFSSLALEEEYAGKQTGVFSGTVAGEVGSYAVYPYNENHRISGNILTYNLPSSYYCHSQSTVVYDWLASEEDIDSYSISANPALYAEISNTEVSASAQFKMLGGMLCVKLDNTPSTEFTLSIIADKKISGDFEVDLSADTPKLKASSESVEDTVTFNMHIPGGSHSFVVYLPVPEGSYNFTVREGHYHPGLIAERIYTSTSKSLTINRGEIKRVTLQESSMTKDASIVIDGHRFVDLGLPSGILWADMNIGASNEADAGDYYAFGELETDSTYTQASYKFWENGSYSKYNNEKTTLDAEDDVVTQKWGSKFRMPTDTELEELNSNCEWTYTTRVNSSGKTVHGSQVRNTTTGATIFIPESGYMDGTSFKDTSDGYLLASTISTASPYNDAHIFYFYILSSTGEFHHSAGDKHDKKRYFGYPVRAIYKKP